MQNGKNKAWWIHTATLIGLAFMILFVLYGYWSGNFRSIEAFQAYMKQFGIWAPVIFVIIQGVQVVIPILPGAVGCVAGVLAFGPLYGFVYNYIGICAGSIAAFWISKRYGSTFVRSVVSEKNYQKYIGWLDKGKKFDLFFTAAIFLPVAPDDLLCYLAGLTKMTYRKFTGIILAGKPISIFLYSMSISSITKMILKI